MARVKKEDRSRDYVRMREIATSEFKETNDCGVIAAAIAFNVSYEESYKAYEKAGRKPRCGVHYYQIEGAAEYLSNKTGKTFKVLDYERTAKITKRAKVNKLTFNNVIRGLNKQKSYMIIGIDHMAALKNGRMRDWSEGTRKYVETIYEIGK